MKKFDSMSAKRPRSADPCWQIDHDYLPEELQHGGWEQKLTRQLVPVAKLHAVDEMACFTTDGPSVEFGHYGTSDWVALSGSPKLVAAARELLFELIPSSARRNCSSSGHSNWLKRIVVKGAQVLKPQGIEALEDFGNPFLGDSSNESREEFYDDAPSPDSEEDSPGGSGLSTHSDGSEGSFLVTGMRANKQDDTNPTSVGETDAAAANAPAVPTPPEKVESSAKLARTVKPRKFRSDTTLGFYQAKMEKMFGMPEGSIRFVNPDGSVAHPSQLVRTLRQRFEKL